MDFALRHHRVGRIASGAVAAAILVLLACASSAFAQAGGKSIFDDDGPGTPAPVKPNTPPPPPPPPRLTPRPETPKPPPPTETTPPPTKPDEPPPPPPVPSKFPLPSAADFAAGQKLVREAFETEYAKTGLADKGNLARALLREVPGNATDGPTLYVLLREARDLAAAGGDAEAVLVASQRLPDAFQIGDEKAFKAEERGKLLAAAKVATDAPPAAGLPPSYTRRAAELIMQAAEQERAIGYYAVAAQVAALAESPAKKFADPAFTARVHGRVAALQAMAAEAEPVRAALATLKTAPDDPTANLTAGAFYAFLLDRFDLGLPRLAKSADATIKSAAVKDLAAGDDVRALALAADAWGEAGKARPPTAVAQREAIQRRALSLYDRAIEGLDGLEAAAIRKKATDLRSTRLKKGGLVGEYFAGRGLDSPGEATLTRIDPAIEFGWRGARDPDPSMPAENFSVRWTGFMKAAAGEYTLFAAHDDSVKLWIGSELVFDFKNTGLRKKKVKFDGTLMPLRIEYEQRGGDSKMGFGWQPPSGVRPRGVPSEMLWYDPPPPAPLNVAPLTDLTSAEMIGASASIVATGVPAGPPGTITLTADKAELHGAEMKLFVKPDRSAVGNWRRPNEWVSWEATVPGGEYEVFLTYSCQNESAGAEYSVMVGPSKFTNTIEGTGKWSDRKTVSLGKAKISNGGKYSIQVRSLSAPSKDVMSLAYLELRPAN